MCKTCVKMRKAAFAVIRTITRPDTSKDKKNQEDTGGAEKSGDAGS